MQRDADRGQIVHAAPAVIGRKRGFQSPPQQYIGGKRGFRFPGPATIGGETRFPIIFVTVE